MLPLQFPSTFPLSPWSWSHLFRDVTNYSSVCLREADPVYSAMLPTIPLSVSVKLIPSIPRCCQLFLCLSPWSWSRLFRDVANYSSLCLREADPVYSAMLPTIPLSVSVKLIPSIPRCCQLFLCLSPWSWSRLFRDVANYSSLCLREADPIYSAMLPTIPLSVSVKLIPSIPRCCQLFLSLSPWSWSRLFRDVANYSSLCLREADPIYSAMLPTIPLSVSVKLIPSIPRCCQLFLSLSPWSWSRLFRDVANYSSLCLREADPIYSAMLPTIPLSVSVKLIPSIPRCCQLFLSLSPSAAVPCDLKNCFSHGLISHYCD